MNFLVCLSFFDRKGSFDRLRLRRERSAERTGSSERQDGGSSWQKEFVRFLESQSSTLTFARDWVSVLGFATVERYSAVWMDWNTIGEHYLTFHRKLSKLNPQIPVIIFTDGSRIDGQLCGRNELIFSVVPVSSRQSEAAEEMESLFQRLELYEKLILEVPSDIRLQIRPNGFGPFVGNSLSLIGRYRDIAKVASTDFTVLITGESGTGKELVAKTIHELSARKHNRFISLNCAAIPETLLESELFGYEKGAFTGANQSKAGKLELADKGTLFLDEIGDMSTNLQAKLLRVLEDHTVERLGGTEGKRVDFRLLTATNREISSLIAEGKFRSDLHYRLNVIQIHLSSLTHLKEDIPLLTLHILGKLTQQNPHLVKSISWQLIEEIQHKSMAGNVRELENILTRLIFHSEGPNLTRKTIKEIELSSHTSYPSAEVSREDGIVPLWEVEKKAILDALSKLNGNISKVAAKLEISRTALYRKIEKYHLTN